MGRLLFTFSLVLLITGCGMIPQGGDLGEVPFYYPLSGQASLDEAVARVFDSPAQASLTGLSLTATLAGFAYDHEFRQGVLDEGRCTPAGESRHHDHLTRGLCGLAAGCSLYSWIGEGDRGRHLQALIESVAITEGMVFLLKEATRRHRPSGTDNRSFPSSHNSFAFTTATFLARYLADATDRWWGNLGYLAYIPAGAVGYGRMAGDRHHFSDVAAGAFLGILVTNMIYNRHFPEDEGDISVRTVPVVDEEYFGLGIEARF